jgi:RNA polymerase sigma-70 factor (ECF subfamily)
MTTRRCDNAELARLAVAARAGDAAALGRIYECCKDDMLLFFRKWIPGEAEDLTQSLFLNLHASLERYHEQGRFRAWLHGVAMNMVRMALRNKNRGSPTTLTTGMAVAPTDTTTLFATRKRELRKLIPRLPRGERAAWELHAAELSNGEIAARLGTTEGAIHTRLSRARDKLARWLTGRAETTKV